MVLLFAACGALPKTSERPSLGLRYRAENPEAWDGDSTQMLRATLAGAPVVVDFTSTESRLVLTVDNPTKQLLHVRIGAQSGSSRDAAIGEVRMQRSGGGRLEGATGYAPFLANSLVSVEPECRAVFYVDAPLGREPSIGEYAGLHVQVGAPGAKPERRLLPIVVAPPTRSSMR